MLVRQKGNTIAKNGKIYASFDPTLTNTYTKQIQTQHKDIWTPHMIRNNWYPVFVEWTYHSQVITSIKNTVDV